MIELHGIEERWQVFLISICFSSNRHLTAASEALASRTQPKVFEALLDKALSPKSSLSPSCRLRALAVLARSLKGLGRDSKAKFMGAVDAIMGLMELTVFAVKGKREPLDGSAAALLLSHMEPATMRSHLFSPLLKLCKAKVESGSALLLEIAEGAISAKALFPEEESKESPTINDVIICVLESAKPNCIANACASLKALVLKADNASAFLTLSKLIISRVSSLGGGVSATQAKTGLLKGADTVSTSGLFSRQKVLQPF